MPIRPAYDDDARVAALCALNILDTARSNQFDRLTRLAAASLHMPIALVSLVDRERQWFKSAVGLDAPETGRDVAFCSHAVEQATLLEVPDALRDSRFANNPLVTGAPHIRFYAGHPIFSPDGHAIGTLCVIDSRPRQLDDAQRALLADLADMAQEEIHKAAIHAARERAERALHELNVELETRVRQRTSDLAVKNQALVREIKQRQQVESTLRQNEVRIQTIIDTAFNAFVGVDENGCIVDWNPAAATLFGWSRDEALGRDFSSILIARAHREDFDMRLQAFLDTPGTDTKLRTELRVIDRHGKDLVVEVAINIFTIGGKRFLGGMIHDISERTAVRRALEQKQQLLDAILESVDVGVVACDAAGTLTLFNRAARLYHGADAEGLDSSAWASRYSLFAPDGETLLAKEAIPLFRALRGEQVSDVAMVIAPDRLARRTLLASGRPLLSSSGEPLGAVVAMKDITELALAQARLAEGERRLRLITDSLPSLIGLVDAEGRLAFVNSRAERFYQKTAAALVGQPVRILYSDAEYALVQDHIAAALRGERVAFEAEAVYKGKPYHYHACYVPHVDQAGKPNGFFAMAFDITERKHSELRQAESEERLRLVTDNLPALISHLDRDLRYTFANARHLPWKGKEPAAMIGRSVQEVFGEDYYAARKDAFARCLAGTTCEFENVSVHEGEQRSMTSNYIPHVANGEVIGIYVLSVDTTAAHLYQHELNQLAHTDVMTGLPNRRHYEERLADALQRARSSSCPVALLFLDIDRFKRINDTLGHAAGDAVLKEFGRRLLASVRQSDTVARLAGDEFTIILDNVASAQSAAQVAAKIVAAMQAPFQIEGKSINVTTSIGVAWSATPCELEMGKLADAALYRSKQAGRNTYTVADAPGVTAQAA